MRSHRTMLGVLSAVGALVACGETTAPPMGQLVVDLVAPTVTTAASAPFGQFAVDVVLRNPSAAAVRLMPDGPGAERENASGQWEPVPAPYSDLMPRPEVDLPPMSELSSRAVISFASQMSGFPSGGVPAGRYRLVYGYVTVGVWGEAQLARSAPFQVVAP